MSYEFYINDVRLPITPEGLTVSIKNQNKTVNLTDSTQFNITKLPGLSEISFDCLLPNIKYPFAYYENDIFRKASYYLGLFEKLKINKTGFMFRVVRGETADGSEMNVTIEDYRIKERAENGGDFEVSVKLLQYTPKTTDIISFPNETTAVADSESKQAVVETKRPVDKMPEDIDYTIASGDTLWGLAKRYLGDGSRWTEIYSANAEVIELAARNAGRGSSSNGSLIFPGTDIRIKGGIR